MYIRYIAGRARGKECTCKGSGSYYCEMSECNEDNFDKDSNSEGEGESGEEEESSEDASTDSNPPEDDDEPLLNYKRFAKETIHSIHQETRNVISCIAIHEKVGFNVNHLACNIVTKLYASKAKHDFERTCLLN